MKTKSIWEPILYGAIAGIVPCLFQRIPILIFLYLFIPILWVDLGRREGFKKTIWPTVIAPIVMIATRNPVMIFTCTLYLALAGIGLSWMYEKEMGEKQRMIFAYAAIFFSIIGGMVIYQVVHHTAFIAVLAKGIEAYAKNITAAYQNTDIFTKSQIAQVQAAANTLTDQTKQALPSFFLILPFFAARILVIACDKTVSRTRPAAQPLKPISHWMMTKPLRNFLLILLIVLLIAQFTVGAGNIYITTLNNLVDLGFSMMGLSFLYWVFNRRLPKESMGRKILICVVLLIIPSSAMFLSLIGIVDVYTNMRLIIVLRDSGRRR